MKLTNPKAQITLERIKKLIKDVAILVDSFPKTTAAFKIAGQIMDSVTSVGANFIEAQSARSKKEFISIMGVTLREINETIFWLDIIKELKLCSIGGTENISIEATELAKIFASIIMTSSKNNLK